ncbi:hypothetical protein LEMLEM_LOCUS9558, partial [Lemmus lemmus]
MFQSSHNSVRGVNIQIQDRSQARQRFRLPRKPSYSRERRTGGDRRERRAKIGGTRGSARGRPSCSAPP